MSIKINTEDKIFSGLSKIFDIVFLSVLWVVFSMPILTIGPATTALYYTTVKAIRKDRGYVWKEFWYAFKTNFVTGLIYTTVLIVAIMGIYYGLALTANSKDTMLQIFHYTYIIVSVLVACLYAFLFPILSRFSLPRLQIMRMALFLSIRHILTTIVLLLLILAGCFAVVNVYPLIFFVPGTITFLCSFLIERVFKKYQPKLEEDTKEENLKWYQTF